MDFAREWLDLRCKDSRSESRAHDSGTHDYESESVLNCHFLVENCLEGIKFWGESVVEYIPHRCRRLQAAVRHNLPLGVVGIRAEHDELLWVKLAFTDLLCKMIIIDRLHDARERGDCSSGQVVVEREQEL